MSRHAPMTKNIYFLEITKKIIYKSSIVFPFPQFVSACAFEILSNIKAKKNHNDSRKKYVHIGDKF